MLRAERRREEEKCDWRAESRAELEDEMHTLDIFTGATVRQVET
jgi:hypothetical protein